MVNKHLVRVSAFVVALCVVCGLVLISLDAPEPAIVQQIQLTAFNVDGDKIEPPVIGPPRFPVGDDGAYRIDINASWVGSDNANFSGSVIYSMLIEYFPRNATELRVVNFNVTGPAFDDSQVLADLLPEGYDEWTLEILLDVTGMSGVYHLSYYYREG